MAKIKKAQSGASAKKEFVKKSFKTADSLRSARIPFGKDVMKEREKNRAKADSIEKSVEKRIGVPRSKNLYDLKKGGKVAKKKK
jgi:hypothetical protein